MTILRVNVAKEQPSDCQALHKITFRQETLNRTKGLQVNGCGKPHCQVGDGKSEERILPSNSTSDSVYQYEEVNPVKVMKLNEVLK